MAGAGAGGAVGVDALRGGDRLDELANAGGQLVDTGGQGVDLVQDDAGQLAVVVPGRAVQRLGQLRPCARGRTVPRLYQL